MAADLISERQLDQRLRLGSARAKLLRLETEAPIDDILVQTDAGGFVFIQAKTSVNLSSDLESQLGKVAQQFVRQWSASKSGDGKRGWDRPLDQSKDRFVLATGAGSSDAVTRDLAAGLASVQAAASAPLPQDQERALSRFRELLAATCKSIEGRDLEPTELSFLLNLTTVLQLDFGRPDRALANAALRDVLEDVATANAAFAVLVQDCQRLMSARLGSDALGFRNTLASSGIKLRAAPSYRADVEALRAYSDRVRNHLEEYEETKVGGVGIRIDRQCTAAVIAAAAEESLLLVGEPGAGKSAVVSSAAAKLKSQGNEVLELAVDRLPVETLDGLRAELELTHSVYEVLRNWPGHGPAYLFIDALDATRGGASEKVFRTLIADVLALPDRRWHVVASIRSFDLRLGEEFRRLFQGRPPSDEYVDTSFSDVRHLLIPSWTEQELADLLQRAPALETAITRGGARLRQLALVPFNTRLLADLISTGIRPEDFGEVGSQVHLLALYWRHRVSKHGAGAELCLRAAVAQMIAARTLRAERLGSAQPDPTAFNELMRENVLVPVSGERYVSFRHHILFDYAASRVYLDPSNLAATTEILKRDKGLGLLLGPALVFALQELWSTSTRGHSAFWNAVIEFAGNAECDPVARSVAARTAAELPSQRRDFNGLVDALGAASTSRTNGVAAISNIVGALSVRVEDKQPLALDPWCELAAEMSRHVSQVIWSLRTLLFLIVERIQTSEQRAELGVASRRLFKHAIEHPSLSQLMSAAVGFVADTYASDPPASRELLRLIFLPEHFQENAHIEVPWLARKLKSIAEVDAAFVAEIYAKSFAVKITDTSTTSMGNSQILPLSSNRRQDFEHAQWELKEFFPKFLEEHPDYAATALIDVISGYVALEHPPSEVMETWTIAVNNQKTTLIEDWSNIWAWNPDDEHGDNEIGILKAVVKRLQTAAPIEATHLANAIASRNKLAVVWSRLFMAAASRPDVLGSVLWPYATKRPFIVSRDTRKDAIDLITSQYPHESAASRKAFEEDVLGIDFPRSSEPESTRKDALEVLFGTIGRDQLVTTEARRFAEAASSKGGTANERPASFVVTSGSGEDWWWLRKEGVDLNAPANADLLMRIKEAKIALQLEQGTGKRSYDATVGAAELAILKKAIETAKGAGADDSVTEYASGVLADGTEKVAGLDVAQLREQPAIVRMLIELIEDLASHANPEVDENTEKHFENSAAWGSPATRIEVAEAAMHLSRVDNATFDRLRSLIERLLGDPHPAVRLSVAQRLTALWETARPAMWELAALVVEREKNRGVVSFFANYFLGRIVHHAPADVEGLTLKLLARFGEQNDEPAEKAREQIGGIIALLWVSHGRSKARATLQSWLLDPAAHEAELGHVFFGIRDALVLGYDTTDARDAAIRVRAQELAAWAVEATAVKLEEYFARCKSGDSVAEGEKERATLSAKLLNNVCDQFYFAAGAFRHPPDKKEGLETVEQKRAFLADVTGTLRRIGDAGTPGTVHHLIELLDFLMPANPAVVFDLTAHTLLGTGRAQGYQFESLGADRVVALVGRFLADHRELFADEERRRKLIACLDVFMEAGWPSARRLLYRLPELLQ
ncbi:MAG: ATP-binding protein [Hyphomicrobium sp.]|nr:ATP-binding protein [Hyphomicrobium sp.]